MSFWTTTKGEQLQGSAESAFVGVFGIIPDGTTTTAMIKDFEIVDQAGQKVLYQISWQIVSDSFKGQILRQKLKVFDDKDAARDRAKNMLKLVCTLCDWKPTHTEAPSQDELGRMKGKICGIKIREFSFISDKGELVEGNWVSEVHPSAGFEAKTGIKTEAVARPQSRPTDSAFQRNAVLVDLNEDLPF